MNSELLSKILGVESDFFRMPKLLTHFIIPFILFTYALAIVLDRLRIFRSSTVHFGIASIISFMSLIYLSSFGLFIGGFSIFIIFSLKVRKKGILVGIIAAIIYWFLIGLLGNVLASIV